MKTKILFVFQTMSGNQTVSDWLKSKLFQISDISVQLNCLIILKDKTLQRKEAFDNILGNFKIIQNETIHNC